MATATPARIGSNVARIDGRLKVTGAANYGADMTVANPAHAFLVTSSIARGEITGIDETEVRALPGVLDVLTYKNVGDAVKTGKFFPEGQMGSSITPLKSAQVWHDGQIVAIVLAESFETARDGAHRLKIAYKEEKPAATFDSASR
mgnify:FL=1